MRSRKIRFLPFALTLTVAIAGIAGGAVAPSVAAGPTRSTLERVVTMQADAGIDVDEPGAVTATSIDSRLVPEVEAALRGKMGAWRFVPVRVDGQARKAHTRVRMVLAASKRGDGYDVRLDSVIFPRPDGGDTSSRFETRAASYRLIKPEPPNYPTDMAMSGVSGIVLVAIRIGPDGSIVDATPVQSLLLDVRGSNQALAAAIRTFERTAVVSARRIRVEVHPAHPGELPPPQTAKIAYQFLMSGITAPMPGEWRNVVRTPKQVIAWEKPSAPGGQDEGAGALDAGSGALIAENDDIHLQTRAAGAPLL